MAELKNWHSRNEEKMVHEYISLSPDPLHILESTRPVAIQSKQVHINREPLERLSMQWLQEGSQVQPSQPPAPSWIERYHFFDGSPRTANWLLVLDALNFCFWADKDQPRWTVTYQDETLNGYWAEAASLKRAIDEGIPLWDAQYLSTISEETVASIFRGTERIPLFEQRVVNTRETGRILLEKYAGQFTNAIGQCQKDAPQLVSLLEQNFPSFQDVATYHGQTVRFLKRAQICVADLYGAFHGHDWGALRHIDQLTIFADYKLPQILRHYNVLEYHPALAQRVDHQEHIQAGSEEEVEIRACTIWACELLRQALQQHGRQVTATEIDMRLWLLSQCSDDMQPYHRTRTIFY